MKKESFVYLDHAATSLPKPGCVLRAVTYAMTDAGGNPGRGTHPPALRAASLIYDARACAASFFGSESPERVLFFPNATYALNTVLHSFGENRTLPTPHPPHILISEMEHNAVVRPLHDMASRGAVTYDVFPVFRSPQSVWDDAEILASIRARIRRETVLVSVCHASNVCGYHLPIEKIGALCHSLGIPFCVDASQSAGIDVIDIARDHIDYLCTAGHKGLLGPQGSGLLLLGENAPPLSALVQGGNGVASLDPRMPEALPESLEAGTHFTPAIAGLCAGMRYLETVGIDTVRGEAHRVRARLREMLLSTPGITLYQSEITDGCVLSFSVHGMSCGRVAGALAEHGICCRSGFHCAPFVHTALGTREDGTVRISTGDGNTLGDAERFYRALKAVLHEG